MTLVDQVVQAVVQNIAFGGMGILRHAGLVLFVPYVAPGETVEVKIGRCYKKYAKASLINILSKSVERVSPLCPYYGKCRGCQLQHLRYPEQVRQKTIFLQDALRRIGKIEAEIEPTVASSQQWGYRRRIRMTLFSRNRGYHLGYVAENREIVIEQCPIFTSDSIIEIASKLVKKLPWRGFRKGYVNIIKNGLGRYVLHFDVEDFEYSWQIESSLISGIESRRQRVGETSCYLELDTLTICYSPSTFIQAHPAQSASIYRLIGQLAHRAKANSVLDLYCGVGISSLVMERGGAKVVGIENNPLSVDLAKKNALNNGCKRVQFITRDVATAVHSLGKEKFDLVVLNPPRSGTTITTLQAIASKKISFIVYISCMPSTLARDLALLLQLGYKIEQIESYDMFPQTTHLETLVFLKLSV